MPYIVQSERDELDLLIGALSQKLYMRGPGALNYAITKLAIGILPKHSNYAMLNEVLGVLTAVPLEFYRRRVAPYEDAKCAENGDVYP